MLPAPSKIPTISDRRGSLAIVEVGEALPFRIARAFIIYDTPGQICRGGHAHRSCEQFLIAICGSVGITVDDGRQRHEHLLDRPDLAIHVPAGIWCEQHYPTAESRLLVLASERYSEADYIRDRAEFLRFKGLAE